MTITIPTPSSFIQIVFAGIGIAFGRAYKKCDYVAQQTGWFKNLSPTGQWFVKATLDALHHWWMGALLMVWSKFFIFPFPSPELPLITANEIFWFGWGLFIDDLPDLAPRLKKLLKYLVA